jgi:serine/threonine-protein kinase HipA
MGAFEVAPVPPREEIPAAVRHWHTALGLDVLEPGFVETPVEDGASIPGVVDKFSAIRDGRRYVIRRHGEAGAYILKLPSTRHPDLVANEFTGYRLCRALGLDCAEAEVIPRADSDLPEHIEFDEVLAVRRFDRVPPRAPGEHVGRIHFEEFCQALNYEPQHKYGQGIEKDFAIMAGVLEQLSGQPVPDLLEFVARFVAFILMGNCDAHLKNWGLLYTDGRTPRLAPLYDPVCVTAFFESVGPRDYGLNRKIDAELRAFTMRDLEAMLARGGLNTRRVGQLRRVARETVMRAKAEWPGILVDAPDSVHRAVQERLDGGVALAGG